MVLFRAVNGRLLALRLPPYLSGSTGESKDTTCLFRHGVSSKYAKRKAGWPLDFELSTSQDHGCHALSEHQDIQAIGAVTPSLYGAHLLNLCLTISP